MKHENSKQEFCMKRKETKRECGRSKANPVKSQQAISETFEKILDSNTKLFTIEVQG